MSALKNIVLFFVVALAEAIPWQIQNYPYTDVGYGQNFSAFPHNNNNNNNNNNYYNYNQGRFNETTTTTKPLYPTLYPQIQPSAPIFPGNNPTQTPSYNPYYSGPPYSSQNNPSQFNSTYNIIPNPQIPSTHPTYPRSNPPAYPSFGHNNTSYGNTNNFSNNNFNPNQSRYPVRPIVPTTPQYVADRYNNHNQRPIGGIGRNGSSTMNSNNIYPNGNNNQFIGNRAPAPAVFDTDPNGIPLASMPNMANMNNLFNHNNLHQRAPNQIAGSGVPLAPFPGR